MEAAAAWLVIVPAENRDDDDDNDDTLASPNTTSPAACMRRLKIDIEFILIVKISFADDKVDDIIVLTSSLGETETELILY